MTDRVDANPTSEFVKDIPDSKFWDLSTRGWEQILNLVFPPACPLCHQFIKTEDSTEQSFCEQCREQAPESIQHPCQRCGAEVGAYVKTESGCAHCSKDRFAFEQVTSLMMYQGEARRLCKLCKEWNYQSLCHTLTRQLWQSREELIRSWNCDLIVPVPMHWGKRLFRNCHPAETIANTLSTQLKIPWRYCLRQTRSGTTQSQLSRTARIQNARELYAPLRRASVKGKSVLLVDDILTTGSTANVCAKALLNSGCSQVRVAVLARATGQT